MRAESQIRVLGTVAAVVHGLFAVVFLLVGVWPWFQRLVLFLSDGVDATDVYVLTPELGTLGLMGYLVSALLLSVLMRAAGPPGRIASGAFGALLVLISLRFPLSLLVVLVRAVGAYAIGLCVAAAFEQPETFEHRTGFERHLEHPWFTALAVFTLSLLPLPNDLAENMHGLMARREQDERDRAVQQVELFAASAGECERADDFCRA